MGHFIRSRRDDLKARLDAVSPAPWRPRGRFGAIGRLEGEVGGRAVLITVRSPLLSTTSASIHVPLARDPGAFLLISGYAAGKEVEAVSPPRSSGDPAFDAKHTLRAADPRLPPAVLTPLARAALATDEVHMIDRLPARLWRRADDSDQRPLALRRSAALRYRGLPFDAPASRYLARCRVLVEMARAAEAQLA